MLYIFFVIACVFSSYMVASEQPWLDTKQNKEYYDKLLDERIKDPVQRAKYNDGYVVLDVGGQYIIPVSELEVAVPVGNDGCFMSFPIDHPIHQALKNRESEISLTKK